MTNEELCIAIQSGTGERQELLEQLYTQNTKMIEKIIRRYRGYEELDDLRQESFFGLVQASLLWKPKKDCKFLTYAVYWIRQAILRYIEECSGIIRVPSNKRQMIRQYDKILNSYRVRFGRDPSDRELCALLDLTPEQLKDLRNNAQALRIRSTSEPVGGEEDDITLEDTIAAAGDPIQDTIERIQREELARELWSCVDELKPKQAAVIRERYRNGRTLKECGEALGCTQQYAKALEEKGLRALRHGEHLKRLRPFLTDQGAYSMGLRGCSVSAFRRNGSSQERAMILLEQFSRMRLWNGKELTTV